MDHTLKKRERFELLLQQALFSNEIINSFFAEGYIDRVEVSRSNRQWIFNLAQIKLLPADIYTIFCKTIRQKFAHIAEIDFVIRYDVTENSGAALVETYWLHCNDWIQKEVPSVNGYLRDAKLEIKGDAI